MERRERRRLTHVSRGGRPRMVDVSDKPATSRRAVAEAFVTLEQATLTAIIDGQLTKGDVLTVAEMAGVDFIVNVTLNGARELTGVYAGGLRQAHQRAVGHLLAAAGIPIDREYDLVVTHAGFVGINHYQAAKAAVIGMTRGLAREGSRYRGAVQPGRD